MNREIKRGKIFQTKFWLLLVLIPFFSLMASELPVYKDPSQPIEARVKDLLSRMTVIQELQGNRSDSVHVLDELVKILPEGVHLTKMVQKGKLLTFDGVAQSNARVSAYMRNIEQTEWLKMPNLKVIQAKKNADSEGYSQFTLSSKQSSPNDKKKDNEG